MPAGERGPMERVLGVYVGILGMTVLLPFTFWRAWDITKNGGYILEVRDGGEDVVINEQVETERFDEGVFFGETGGDWIEEKEDNKAVKPEAVTKDMKKNKQMSKILDRISKLEQEVNVALL